MPPSSRSSDVSLRLYCEHIVEVDIKAERALTETKILQAREALEHARVVKLEAEVERLKAELSAISVSDGAGFKREKFDPALQRVRFAGWPAAKRAAIEAFLSQHSPNTPVVYIGEFGAKASFAHFGTPRDVKTVLEMIKDKKKSGFDNVKIAAALTSTGTSRNYVLYKAV